MKIIAFTGMPFSGKSEAVQIARDLDIPVIRMGDMVWEDLDTQTDFLRDKFTVVRMAVLVELDKIRYVKPYLMAGYQKMNDLSLALVSNEDFSGLFFGLGVRIGYFNQ